MRYAAFQRLRQQRTERGHTAAANHATLPHDTQNYNICSVFVQKTDTRVLLSVAVRAFGGYNAG